MMFILHAVTVTTLLALFMEVAIWHLGMYGNTSTIYHAMMKVASDMFKMQLLFTIMPVSLVYIFNTY